MFYLVIISSTFRKSSLAEIERISKFRIAEEFVGTLVIESREKKFAEKLMGSKPIFVYNISPLEPCSEISQADYLGSIYAAMLKQVPRKGTVRIECFDVNSKTEYSAKDIEVSLGKRLEKEKHVVDMESPEYLVYLVLINMKCYVGRARYEGLEKKFISPERHYHQHSASAVSRSELKLIEAFDEFGIKGGGIAIDLGAAPGGWSKFLAKSGFKVIAIDNGELDYKKIRESGLKVKVIGAKSPKLEKAIAENEIIHIKANAREASIDGLIKADLIVDDMNIMPKESAEILLSYSKNLSKNGKIVLTIKCVDRKADKHIRNAQKTLGKRFKIKGIRVLPGNRQELTLYAVSNHSKSK